MLITPFPFVVRSSKLTSHAMLCLLLGVTGQDNDGGGGTGAGAGGGGKDVSSKESSENRSSSLLAAFMSLSWLCRLFCRFIFNSLLILCLLRLFIMLSIAAILILMPKGVAGRLSGDFGRLINSSF